jgi:PilZ domain
MYENGKKTPYRTTSEEIAVKEAERRCSDRHMFTASADIVELASGARFSTRTTDLGPGGCFIDTTNPFSVGSKVQLLLRKGKTEFQTHGVVVYSQNGLGMGIAFNEVNPAQQAALQLWLAEITGEAVPVHELKRPGKLFEQEVSSWLRPTADRATVVRLIRLLITKGILTEAEGSHILMDPVL